MNDESNENAEKDKAPTSDDTSNGRKHYHCEMTNGGGYKGSYCKSTDTGWECKGASHAVGMELIKGAGSTRFITANGPK